MPKKYFWLKLKTDFFQQREMKKLRKIAGGPVLTIIYLKMQLLSLQDKGEILFAGTEKNVFEQIALEIDEEVENVEMLVSFLVSHQLVEISDEQDLLLIESKEAIGSETAAASRMRAARERKKQQVIEHQEKHQEPVLITEQGIEMLEAFSNKIKGR